MDKGTLSFSLNGEDFGEAYTDNELKKGPLYAAVALLHCSGCTLKGELPIPSIYASKWYINSYVIFCYFAKMKIIGTKNINHFLFLRSFSWLQTNWSISYILKHKINNTFALLVGPPAEYHSIDHDSDPYSSHDDDITKTGRCDYSHFLFS